MNVFVGSTSSLFMAWVGLLFFLVSDAHAVQTEFDFGEDVKNHFCDNADHRKRSDNPFVARVRYKNKSKSCTATLVSKSCVLSAAHCVYPDLGEKRPIFLEFNTPKSDRDGNMVDSKIRDRYLINYETMEWQLKNVASDDWAVFKVYPNSETNKLPGEEQNGHLEVSYATPSEEEKITTTGYGANYKNLNNRAQQRSEGRIYKIEQTATSQYKYFSACSYTTPGGSGTAVVNTSGAVIGLLTGGDYVNYGYAVGPSVHYNPKLQAAIKSCVESDNY